LLRGRVYSNEVLCFQFPADEGLPSFFDRSTDRMQTHLKLS
jgi:hypothetical protein